MDPIPANEIQLGSVVFEIDVIVSPRPIDLDAGSGSGGGGGTRAWAALTG